MERKNPVIVTNVGPMPEDETFNTAEPNFMMAFAVYSDLKFPLSDERYIKWVVRL